MDAVVIYESLTGNTRKAARRISVELAAHGISAPACPITRVDLEAVHRADLVIVGTWVDGMFMIGQRPGRAGRMRTRLPAIHAKKTLVYCTYAVDPGKTLEKLTNLVADKGADVVGGLAIRRSDLAGGAADLVERMLAAGVLKNA